MKKCCEKYFRALTRIMSKKWDSSRSRWSRLRRAQRAVLSISSITGRSTSECSGSARRRDPGNPQEDRPRISRPWNRDKIVTDDIRRRKTPATPNDLERAGLERVPTDRTWAGYNIECGESQISRCKSERGDTRAKWRGARALRWIIYVRERERCHGSLREISR